MEKIEPYLPTFLGLIVFTLLTALGKTHVLVLSAGEVENLLIDIFASFAIAQLMDVLIRDRQFRRIAQEELKRGLDDNTKLFRFDNADEAYEYLSKKLPQASAVHNTIIHAAAYSSEGVFPPTKYSRLYNKRKHKLIKSGAISWEDVISPEYKEYIEQLFREHYRAGVSKYSAFFLTQPVTAFQNFIILEYPNEYAEVIVGWVVTYGGIRSGQNCFLIANKGLVRHYQEYFAAIRANNCRLVDASEIGLE
ncbi:MAG: hypothetical protein QOH65_2139 [Methylobacteriaceae bacterium]|jgi:hypothetical protein|nr:hypothetical protein [Methylobacteriaceae bacterium]